MDCVNDAATDQEHHSPCESLSSGSANASMSADKSDGEGDSLVDDDCVLPPYSSEVEHPKGVDERNRDVELTGQRYPEQLTMTRAHGIWNSTGSVVANQGPKRRKGSRGGDRSASAGAGLITPQQLRGLGKEEVAVGECAADHVSSDGTWTCEDHICIFNLIS